MSHKDAVASSPLLMIAAALILKIFDPDSFDPKQLTGEQRKCLPSLRENRLKLGTNLLLLANSTIEKALDIEKTTLQKEQTKP